MIDMRRSLCSISVAVVAIVYALPMSHGYRLAQGIPTRQILPEYDDDFSKEGNQITNISAAAADREGDQEFDVGKLATIADLLDLMAMLKSSNWNGIDDDFEPPETDYPYPSRDAMLDSILSLQLGRPRPLSSLGSILHSGFMDKGKDRMSGDKRSSDKYWVAKRRFYNCNLRKATLNTIIEYIRYGRICGYKVAHVRFGLGRK